MKRYLCTIMPFLMSAVLSAQEARNYGAATFLNITPDARSLALGGAGTGIGGNSFAFYHNGASMMRGNDKWTAAYSYFPWLRNNTLHSLGGFYRLGAGSGLFGGLRYYTYQGLDALDEDGNPVSSFTPKEWSMDVGYALTITGGLSASVTARLIRSDMGKIADAGVASSGAFDLGLFYSPLEDISRKIQWTAGLSLRNVGTKMKYLEVKEEIPARLSAGGSVCVRPAEKHTLMAVCDLGTGLYPSQTAGLDAGVGLEYGFKNLAFLRGGYHYGDKEKGNHRFTTIGAGLKYKGIGADFTYLMADRDGMLKDTFVITVGYQLDGK